MWEPYGAPGQFNGYQGQMPSQYSQSYYNQVPKPDFQGITVVDGAEGARACLVPSNSRVLLMDRQCDRFWIKTVDQYNMATLQEYEFREVKAAPDQSTNYVSMEQFSELQQELNTLKEQYELNTRKSSENVVTVSADDWD